MEPAFFIKGLILGFSIAAPVGPIGVLCIRRTLTNGILNGFISGLGTATADAIYGCIAAFGITAAVSFFIEQQTNLRLIGGLYLLYLGYTTFIAQPADQAAKASGESLPSAYLSAFFLTLTNPMTIMMFAALFAGVGIGANAANYSLAGLMVAGVFTGSLLWWLILSSTVSVLRSRFDHRKLKWVNQLSGVIIVGFGLISLFS